MAAFGFAPVIRSFADPETERIWLVQHSPTLPPELSNAFGFIYARTKGSHLSYKHPSCPKLMVIQPVGKDAKRYRVREFLDLVREFDLYIKA
jgi:hypothetical protein